VAVGLMFPTGRFCAAPCWRAARSGPLLPWSCGSVHAWGSPWI